MLKKALKNAIAPGIGGTLGGVVLPKILFGERYNATYPNIVKHVLFRFVVVYISCFLVSLFILWFKEKSQDKI